MGSASVRLLETSSNHENSVGGWTIANNSKLWKEGTTSLTNRSRPMRILIRGIVKPNPPTAANVKVTTDEDSSYAFSVESFGYSDLDGDELSVLKIETLPSSGKGVLMLGSDNVSAGDSINRSDLVSGHLIYVPPSNGNGEDYASFRFKVNDGSFDSDDSYTMSIDVVAVNDLPTSANGRVSLEEDSSYAFRTDDFTYADVDNDVLASIKIVTVPGATKGELRLDGAVVSAGDRVSKSQLDDGDLSYVPPANGNGDDFASFTFKVNDGQVDSADTYTMAIDVGVVNDLPSGGSGRVTTKEDTSYTFRTDDFTYADIDNDVLSSIKIVTVPGATKGELRLDGAVVSAGDRVSKSQLDDGDLSYVPPANGNGDDFASFTFKVNDGQVDSADTYTMAIDVGVVNDLPSGGSGRVTTKEDTSYTFRTDDFTYADIDNDVLSSIKIVTVPGATKGELRLDGAVVSAGDRVSKSQLDDGDLSYVPPANGNGDDFASFTFKVNDGQVDSADTYTMAIDVGVVNDLPSGGSSRVTTEEDTSYSFRTDDFTYADIDNDVLSSIKIVTVPGATKGELRLDGAVVSAGDRVSKSQLDDGDLSYVPPANGNGDDFASFTFKVNDGQVDSADTYTMAIDVGVVNDLPSGGSSRVTTEEDTSYSFRTDDFTYADIDNDVLSSIKIVTVPGATKGELRLDGAVVSAGDRVSKSQLDDGDRCQASRL